MDSAIDSRLQPYFEESSYFDGITTAHNSPSRSCDTERIGPWPLKRNQSSQTTIVASPGIDAGCKDSPKINAGRDRSELAEFLEYIDKQCETIRRLTETEMSQYEGSEDQRATSTMDNKIRESHFTQPNAHTEESTDKAEELFSHQNVESRVDDESHELGSCCKRCFDSLRQRAGLTRKRYSKGALIRELIDVLIPFLLGSGIGKKFWMYGMQVSREYIQTALFGGLHGPIAAVSILIGIFMYASLREGAEWMVSPTRSLEFAKGIFMNIARLFFLLLAVLLVSGSLRSSQC